MFKKYLTHFNNTSGKRYFILKQCIKNITKIMFKILKIYICKYF